MSARFVPVGWNRSKVFYDVVLLAAVGLFLLLYRTMAERPGTTTVPTDEGSLAIKVYGACAFLLLTIALAIGPLTRIDRRFLPLLYNRRHLGIVTCAVAAAHGWAVIDWYFAFSPTDPWVALFTSEPGSGTLAGLPFVLFGVIAFVILSALAATSHDFWLAFLGAGIWKGLHMAIYLAYALVVIHVALGPLQGAQRSGFVILVLVSAVALVVLHVWAAWRERQADAAAPQIHIGGLFVVGRVADVPEGGAVIVRPPGSEAIAVFNDGGLLSAVSHVCAHQNGPIGEGRVVDGCVVCPWHGHQFRLTDGCAPPPYTDRIEVYRLERDGETLLLDQRPLPQGTVATPLQVMEGRP